MAQTDRAKLDRLLAKLPSLARRHPARLPSPSHHLPLPGLLQVRQQSRTSAVGTQRQLSWRQEPSDQFASRPVASGTVMAQKPPPGEEDSGGDLRAQPALFARRLQSLLHLAVVSEP